MVNIITTITSGRSFSGLIGLEYSINDNKLYWSRTDILNLVQNWISLRISKNKSTLSIIISQQEDLFYIYNNEIVSEPCIRLYGEINSYSEHLSDNEILTILNSLFKYLGTELQQRTIRFTYWGFDDRASYRLQFK